MIASQRLYRFEEEGRHYVVDPETCFCFECDAISWDVLDHYPNASLARLSYLLKDKHPIKEIEEVFGELEWLRASKSILPLYKQSELAKRFEFEKGLRLLSLLVPENEGERRPLIEAAFRLLLARSGEQKDLCFELRLAQGLPESRDFLQQCEALLASAALSGKKIQLCLTYLQWSPPKCDELIQPHRLDLRVFLRQATDCVEVWKTFSASVGLPLKKAFKRLQTLPESAHWDIVLTPGQAHFQAAVEALRKTGAKAIHLDLATPNDTLTQSAQEQWETGLKETAVYYAKRLLSQDFFRLEPIAGLFHRIYEGKPLARIDPAGANALAVNAQGDLYPATAFFDDPDFSLGNLLRGEIDEAQLKSYEDVGSQTTASCMSCWARNLCGGGYAAIHYARSGSYRKPDEAWCEGQRRWCQSAIVAFNLLSSAGVNFTRIYGGLEHRKKASLFSLARAAMSMHLGLRPIGEDDAELLTRWENWNTSAYFLCNETGLLMATRYDREMDSLHPNAFEQEFMILSRKGEAKGLLKLRPAPLPGTADLWVFLQDAKDYADPKVRKSFRFLLEQAAGQGALGRLMISVTPQEPELQDFLISVGFQAVGRQREALYLHGNYHDLSLYVLDLKRG